MKLIIDTNIIISALIKPQLTRTLILNVNFELMTPAFTLSEIDKHKEEICKKGKIDKEELDTLIHILFRYIEIINPITYSHYLEEAKNLIPDKEDIPFVACALVFNCPIWSDDKHFQQQKKIKIWKTEDIIKIIEESD